LNKSLVGYFKNGVVTCRTTAMLEQALETSTKPVRELDIWNITKFQSLLYRVIEELHPGSIWLETLKSQYSLDVLKGLIGTQFAICPAIYSSTGELVGLGIGRHEGGLGTISWIVVDPQYRGMSIGSKILETMIGYYQSKGCHRVELKTYLNDLGAQNFYKNQGFDYAAVLPNHKFGFDIAYMIKDIEQNVKHLRRAL